MVKPKEIAEISLAMWYLPLDKIQEVKALVLSLRERHGYAEPMDDSDEWTGEDRREWSEATLQQAEQGVPWEEKGNAQAG